MRQPSHDDILTKLSERVRGLRNERGFSQGELAERAQLSRWTVVALELQRGGMSLTTAARLARALNTTVTDLIDC